MDCMEFPNTFDEFADDYKIVDSKEIYTNGAELIPIFRVKQWLEHINDRPKGEWIEKEVFDGDTAYECSECGELFCLIDGTPTDNLYNFCPNCGADMRGKAE